MKKIFVFFVSIVLFSFSGFSKPCELDYGYEENSPLFFGNPSDAVSELSSAENYLLVKDQFVVSYNASTLCPNWVGWHLSASDIGEAGRSNKFVADKQLPQEFYAVTQSDYKFPMYGFDRGHICPSADRTATVEDNKVTFLMTNMVPQAPDNNRIVWVGLENYEREIALKGNELYIFAGPAGSGGIGQKGAFDNIPVELENGSTLFINVPEYTWKILLILPEGNNDLERVTKDSRVICVNVPNIQGCNSNGNWEQYKCTIDDIESITGYDFFELLPDEIEEYLEAGE